MGQKPPVRILVVEDERKVASFVARALRETAYSVDVAETGDPVFSTPNNPVDNPVTGPQPASALGSYFGSIGSTTADNRQLRVALKLIW